MTVKDMSNIDLMNQLGMRTESPDQFKMVYGPAAERAGKAIGVDPGALLSQWGLETGWGKSIVPGTNNLGNIKDFRDGSDGVSAVDNMTGSTDKYRKFGTVEDFADHYAGLISRKYKGAVGAGSDINKFAGALKSGGYAEDPDYVEKLVSIYQKNNPGVMDRIASAVMPAAQASGVPEQSNLSGMSDEELMAALGGGISDDDLMAQIGPVSEGISTPEGRRALVEDSLRSPFDNSTPLQGTQALGAGLGQGVGQVAMGAQHWLGKGLEAMGAKDTGAWLVDDAAQGRASLEEQARPFAETAPFSAGAGRIAGNVAAVGPVGKVLGGAVSAISGAPRAAQLANALRSGGMNLGGQAATSLGGKALDLGIRAAGGGMTGGAMAGLVNPDDAATGAMIGAAFPVAGQAVATGSKALGRALRGGEISDDVVALANRAKQLGINVPADRIANSKPLNAAASSLEYVPLSGRSATLDKMQTQFNRAIAKTFGQESDNVTMALRKASADLGQKFDDVLQNNAVRVDDQFIDDLIQASSRASNELESGQARIITNQIDEILSKVTGNQVDGQAAYNIKKTLDRIGKRNSPEAHYADDLRKSLMNALNRSLGPDDAQSFAKVREQYGNMLTLRRFAQNGVDGDVSIARIANMKDIRSPELQELADIAAQFLKPREGAHGAAQRVVAGAAAATLGGPVALGAGMGAGRLGNMLLNSNTARNAILRQPSPTNLAIANGLRQAMPATSRFMPVLAAQ